MVCCDKIVLGSGGADCNRDRWSVFVDSAFHEPNICKPAGIQFLALFISLAFPTHTNKGVCVLLLASAVSRSSRIPTGWEIVLELIRKVAALSGEVCESKPAAWYARKLRLFG
jgi:hypothetical protein